MIKGNEHGEVCLCYKYAKSSDLCSFSPCLLKVFFVILTMFEQTFKLIWTEGELGGKRC